MSMFLNATGGSNPLGLGLPGLLAVNPSCFRFCIWLPLTSLSNFKLRVKRSLSHRAPLNIHREGSPVGTEEPPMQE